MPKKVAGTIVRMDGKSTRVLNVKSVNPWDIDNPSTFWAWTDISGSVQTKEQKEAMDYFATVPWLRRGVTMIATRVATVPFIIRDFKPEKDGKLIIGGKVGKKEVDNSSAYTNAVKFLSKPKDIMWLMCASRQLTGRAYLHRAYNKNNVTKSLKYLSPNTIKPEYTERGEVDKWVRRITTPTGEDGKGGKIIQDNWELEEVVYSWYADPYTEMGPPKIYPALAALSAAGVLSSLDTAASGFFQGGMMKQTVFTVPANTDEPERERVESVLTRTLMGVGNFLRRQAKVFNADAFNATVIGDGMEGLEASGLTESKREDIAAALGIPASKLFSNDTGGLGGGGVVEQDEINFLRETVLPEAEAIFEDLNEQLFHPAEYHIEINEQSIDAFQEDETARSVAVQSLASSVSLNPEAAEFAMDLLGYELSEEQKAKLEALKQSKQEQRDVNQQRFGAFGQPNANNQDIPQDPEEKTADELKELGQWQRFALRTYGKDGAEFEPRVLKQKDVEFIKFCLTRLKGKENVKSLFAAMRFSLSPTLEAALRSALNKANSVKRVDAIFADIYQKGHKH